MDIYQRIDKFLGFKYSVGQPPANYKKPKKNQRIAAAIAEIQLWRDELNNSRGDIPSNDVYHRLGALLIFLHGV